MFPSELQETLRRLARTLRRIEVLRDIADNEDGGGIGSVDLLDLYVPAWLCLDRDVRGAQDHERALYRKLHDPALSPDERSQVARAHAGDLMRPWIPEWRLARRFSPLQALAAHRHVAVVAPPGAGKSTLLRIIALAQIDPTFGNPWGEAGGPATPEPTVVPVLLRLADYAAALADEPDLGLATFLVRGAAHAEVPLRAGQALLLLDGLDEVPSLALRKRIASAILALLDAAPGLRCVVTTRPNGAVHLPEFAVFHLDLFTEDMAIEFLARWRACQRRASGAAVEYTALHAEAVATWRQLRAHPSLVELARNPLLLAILAVCQQARVELPHDRVQFYERALRTLLGTWNHARSEDDEGLPSLEVQWRAWGELTLELRDTCPNGVFRRELLVERLIAWLVAFGEQEADSRRLAEELFDVAVHRHGLLERRGGGDFVFWHPTFGEYLAAVAIARDPGPQRLVALRDDLRNTEIAAMVLAHVATVQGDRRRATRWLVALAGEDEGGWGSLLAPALSFAVGCVLRGCAVDSEGIEMLLRLAIHQIVRLPHGSWSDPFRRLVGGQPRFTPGPALVTELLPLSRPPRAAGTAWARPAAMRLLANACASDRNARAACRQVAPTWDEDTELLGNRESVGLAALGLLRAGELASAWLPAISGLAWFREGGDGLALSDDGVMLREALRRLLPGLGERLADASPRVRHAAALALALVDDARPAVVDPLFAAADGPIVTGAVESLLLARLARGEAAVAERLVACALVEAGAGDQPGAWAGACLARALGAAGEHCHGILRRLIDALSDELERADGPAQRLLERLVSAPERPHLSALLVEEAHGRLLANPDATVLVLRCVLLIGSFDGSEQVTELLFACARRGGIDQRILAHEQIDQGFYRLALAEDRGRIAELEVELFAEALGHDSSESIAWAPGWQTSRVHVRDRPRTWGRLAEMLVWSIEHRLNSSDQRVHYLTPLAEALASPDERVRRYAAVLLAPVTATAEERARLVPILADGLADRDRWLRVRAAAWLVDRRDDTAAAAAVAIGLLQFALCAEHSVLSRGEFAERLARLGPPNDEVVHALLRDAAPAHGVDPTWLFTRIEVVDLIASYLGDEDDRLHHRAHDLLERGRGRPDVTEALYRRGLAAGPDEASNLAIRLGMDLEGLDRPRDPRVTTLWRRALASTHPGVLARAFDAVLWRDEPDEALAGAARRVLASESLYLRVLVAWGCVSFAVRDRDGPVDVEACATGLQALGVSAECLITALLPIADDPGPWLRAAAAVLLHVLGGPRETVHLLLTPLRELHVPFHEHFSLWGPDWCRLAQLVAPAPLLEHYDCLEHVDRWTLAVQASGLGMPDATLPGRLLADLLAALAAADEFPQRRRAVLLLRMMLASSPESAALGLDAVFSRLRSGAEEDAAENNDEASADRRSWRLLEYFLEDDRVLARVVEHMLRRWPAASSRRNGLLPRSVSASHHARLRVAVREFVQAPDPAIRGAAARWCVQLGEHDAAVLGVWLEALFAESVAPQVFSLAAWMTGDEATRGLGHACDHPGLWQDSPARTRTLLALLERCDIPPPGAAAVVRAALMSPEREHRRAAAALCASRSFVDAPDELAAIWRDALVVAGESDDTCEIAEHLLAVAPGDPAAIAALRECTAGDNRYQARQACEALATCPSEQGFVRGGLGRIIEDPASDSRTLAWALAQLLRTGEPAPDVASRAITAMLCDRLQPGDLVRDGAERRFHGVAPRGWPMARGEELAEQPTFLDDALAAALAATLGVDIETVGPRWRRLAEGAPCPLGEIHEVVALLTVRPDDDDRNLFARGYWYGRLPHDRQRGLVLPPVMPPPEGQVDGFTETHEQALHTLLGSLFSESHLRRFLGFGEQGSSIVQALPVGNPPFATLVDGAVSELIRRGLVASIWRRLHVEFPARGEDIDRVATLWSSGDNPQSAAS